MTQPTISTERIEEMLAGLEGPVGAVVIRGDDLADVRTAMTLALSALHAQAQAQGSEAVAWQWRQTVNGKWCDNWNHCDRPEYWKDLAARLPSEVQVRELYASPPVQAQPQVTEHIEYLERAETRLREFALSVDAGEAQGGAREWDRRIWASFAELRDALATPPAPVDGGVTGALSGIIAAWEATKPGDTTRTEIQRWLIEDMKPAIDYARAALTASRAAVAQDETP